MFYKIRLNNPSYSIPYFPQIIPQAITLCITVFGGLGDGRNKKRTKWCVLILLPIYGQARQIYIEKQIKKSYEENRKQFAIVVQSVKSYL